MWRASRTVPNDPTPIYLMKLNSLTDAKYLFAYILSLIEIKIILIKQLPLQIADILHQRTRDKLRFPFAWDFDRALSSV